ncbi:hypothetical protein [Desulfospira joergensenii]|uniref:hypothetical protein n=1 Tax=Desulfospira joergensenii TaxID=53329 RepID=UPI0003B39B3B|nr:hypothetical protein [Desulfospira joergensenii]
MFFLQPSILKRLIPFLGLFMVMISGCGPGLPDQVKDKAANIPDTIERTRKIVEKDRKKFESLKSSPEFKALERFAQKENWEAGFQKASSSLDRAETLFKKELKPLLKQDKPELAQAVLAQTDRITQVIQEAGKESKFPLNRFVRLQTAVRDMPEIREKALSRADAVTSLVDSLESKDLQKAKADFPDSAKEIDKKFALFTKMRRENRARAQALEKEFKIHESGQAPDYALFIDSADGIARDYENSIREGKEFKSRMDQLSHSYTKVLQDMKAEYFVVVKRESWDERSDFSNPRQVSFQRQVSPETFEVLAESELESIASIVPGFMGASLKNRIGKAWSELNINPTDQWPGKGHNAADFWIERTDVAYYHKYLLEEDGETKETGWEKVNPSFYEQHYEDLGMAIVSKPYGVFEEDRLTQAAPPGISYVGNPKYGEWKKDEKGDSFWSWYGRYAFFSSMFFFPPSYFYYNSWHGWNNNYRHQRPYYGASKTGARRYGTFGSQVKNSPRYQSSSFARTGGFKSRTPSVRGAGARVRGGGPGGKGK